MLCNQTNDAYFILLYFIYKYILIQIVNIFCSYCELTFIINNNISSDS